jgi:ATP-dependent DNA helicase RecG
MISKKDGYPKKVQSLCWPVSHLKGVGPKRARLLAQKGLYTVLDLLFFTPLRYEDRTTICPIHETQEGMPLLVKGNVISGGEERFYSSRKRLFRIRLRDQKSVLDLIWFNYKKPHLQRFATQGMQLLAYGTIRINRGHRQMIHPEVSLYDAAGDGETESRLAFYPVYSTVPGISGTALRSFMRNALDQYAEFLVDPVPPETARGLGLPELDHALRSVHFPDRQSSVDELNRLATPAHRRLLFDRFFLVMLVMAFRKKSREKGVCPVFCAPPNLNKKLDSILPFTLTSQQRRAVQNIAEDLAAGKPMNRLLLGDVGCGKTVVAAVAAYITVQNKRQVAIMAPTQILAAQHLEYFTQFSEKMGFRPVLLTSGLRKADRREIYDRIKDGSYNLIIGTQALIQEEPVFSDLGLAVIDEQHRFGVRDRALMDQKGDHPHLLVMTATPIPRTLAITLYGDMDISTIRGYPTGRLPVLTRMVREDEKRMLLDSLIRRLSQGQRAFVICPVIEGSEDVDLKNAVDMTDKLRKVISPRFQIGLIHGRLPADMREAVMGDFRKGEIHVLVATTIIEVGVHVPSATVMIIEDPERFGLAQLHQLRGRVGRGRERGVCFLVVSRDLSEKALSRLEVFVENHDGFKIAEEDLAQRGLGELTGTRQTGVGDLDLGDMIWEPELLSRAKLEARRLIDDDPELQKPQNRLLRAFVESVLTSPLDL